MFNYLIKPTFENHLRNLFQNSAQPFSNVYSDIIENDNEYQILIEIPLYKKEFIDLEVNDDILSIKGEMLKANDNNTKYLLKERIEYNFNRKFQLQKNIKNDSISATFNDNLLKIIIPKNHEKIESKKILIS